ncbi:hypothetical protein D3C81_947300 [compost metagenome]
MHDPVGLREGIVPDQFTTSRRRGVAHERFGQVDIENRIAAGDEVTVRILCNPFLDHAAVVLSLVWWRKGAQEQDGLHGREAVIMIVRSGIGDGAPAVHGHQRTVIDGWLIAVVDPLVQIVALRVRDFPTGIVQQVDQVDDVLQIGCAIIADIGMLRMLNEGPVRMHAITTVDIGEDIVRSGCGRRKRRRVAEPVPSKRDRVTVLDQNAAQRDDPALLHPVRTCGSGSVLGSPVRIG